MRGLLAGVNKSVAEYANQNGYYQQERDYQFYKNRYQGEHSNAERGFMPLEYLYKGIGGAVDIAVPFRSMFRKQLPNNTYITNDYYGGQVIGR